MPKARLEAFSDGVIAIIITIMVLEMKVPHDGHLDSLKPVLPVFLSYILSFVYLGIYWNNHHHLLHAAKHINGKIMWANLHLLFWLSLIPFVSGWLGEHGGAVPTAFYGGVLFMAGLAYLILQNFLVESHGRESLLASALGRDWKGQVSVIGYLLAIILAFVQEWLAHAIYVFVALMWFVPDQRIEKRIQSVS
ncbi:MAG: TMEM175 family protein [Candidatus Omnitrophota bacterium]